LLSTQYKIKLLIFIPSIQCGGSEKYISMLCNNIDTQKFDVTLGILDNADPFYNIINKAVEVVDLNSKTVRHSFFKIKQLVKKIQPDIVYTTANHLNLYFAIFKKSIAPKSIIVARESSVVSINSKRAKFPVFYNWLIKIFYKQINFIICQSRYMQQDLIDNYNIKKEKTIVINNAVEENILPAAPWQKNKFITVARLSEEKGIDRLIHSVANLTIPFTYYIIGDGGKKETLQNLINQLQLQNKVFLTGKKDSPFAGMEDAALFLMGSHYEGFPNTLLEAGALGIPVVAFNAPGGISEIIVEGENGLLVKDGDEKVFAAAIETAMNSFFSRQQIKDSTQKMFSLNLTIKKTEDLFLQLHKNFSLLK
jgi:glycosyltransferase involved in cell wall biosynthesis